MRQADVRAQLAPQRRHEGRLGHVVAAALPRRQPVRPVDQVLRVQPRQPVGQLVAPARRVAAGEVGAHLRVVDCGQMFVDAPAQAVAPIRRERHRAAAQFAQRQFVQPGAGQADAQVGDDAGRPAPPRQRAGQPVAHARMRRDHRLRRQHLRRRRAVEQDQQRIEQGLEPARAIDHEAVVDVVRGGGVHRGDDSRLSVDRSGNFTTRHGRRCCAAAAVHSVDGSAGAGAVRPRPRHHATRSSPAPAHLGAAKSISARTLRSSSARRDRKEAGLAVADRPAAAPGAGRPAPRCRAAPRPLLPA